MKFVRESGVSDIELFRYRPFVMSALEFVSDASGALLVDEVFKFEDRAVAMKIIADRLGMTNADYIHFQAATAVDRHYSEAFDDTGRRLVEKMFGEEIERFGFRFGVS